LDGTTDGAPDLIRPGDVIVDCFGVIYPVLLADEDRVVVEKVVPDRQDGQMPDYIWYAPPSRPGGPSPLKWAQFFQGIVKP
jgi:hypothetical protein